MQQAPRVGIASALQVREIRKGWKDWEVLSPMVVFKAGLSARPAQVTSVLAPVSSQRRSHPEAAQLRWEKLFPCGQLELSLLQLLHSVTCPFPDYHTGLWAFPSGTKKPLGNLRNFWGISASPGWSHLLTQPWVRFTMAPKVFLRREKWGFKQITQQLHELTESFCILTRSEHYATKTGQVKPF